MLDLGILTAVRKRHFGGYMCYDGAMFPRIGGLLCITEVMFVSFVMF